MKHFIVFILVAMITADVLADCPDTGCGVGKYCDTVMGCQNCSNGPSDKSTYEYTTTGNDNNECPWECNAGYYKTGSGTSATCIACPDTYPFSAVDSTSIDNCYLTLEAGEYVEFAASGPTDCAIGNKCEGGDTIYYGGTTTTGGMTACNQGNEYQDKTGRSTCEICPGEGNYEGNNRTLGLEQCWKALEWGNDTNGGRINCYHSLKQGAASGTYNGEDNNNGCDSWEAKCEVGKYYKHQVMGSCETCKAGYYCGGYGDSGGKVNFGTGYGLTPCPVGKTSDLGQKTLAGDKGADGRFKDGQTGCYIKGSKDETGNNNDCTCKASGETRPACSGKSEGSDAGVCTKFCDSEGCFYLPVNVYY
jgi:hypothetical protein